MGRTRVRLTVGKPPRIYSSMSPQHILSVSLEPSSKGAALLTTDTEVSIAPKPHQRSKSTALPRDIIAQEDSLNRPPNLPEVALRVLPTRLLGDVPPLDSTYTGSGTLAYVHPYTFSVLTETEWPTTGDFKNEFVKLSYRDLPPPSDPLQAPQNEADMELPKPSTQRAGSGNPELDTEKPVEFPADNVLFVGSSDKVTESHILFLNGTEGVRDWHWIQ